jgi:hypothetical protein
MIITRKNLIRYWASGPDIGPIEPVPEGCVVLNFSQPALPDIATLSPSERELLRPVLATHPEYLYEIIPTRRTQPKN